MAFAYGLLLAKKFKILDDTRDEALFTKGITWLVAVAAILGFGVQILI